MLKWQFYLELSLFLCIFAVEIINKEVSLKNIKVMKKNKKQNKNQSKENKSQQIYLGNGLATILKEVKPLFESYFGPTSTIYIPSTHRNSQELQNIAGPFVKKDPALLIHSAARDQILQFVQKHGGRHRQHFLLVIARYDDPQYRSFIQNSAFLSVIIRCCTFSSFLIPQEGSLPPRIRQGGQTRLRQTLPCRCPRALFLPRICGRPP